MGTLCPRGKIKKALKIMKLTTLFTLMLCMQLHASVYSQQTRLSLKLSNVDISRIFSEIEKQSDYAFTYPVNEISVDKKMSIDVKNVLIDEIMSTCLNEVLYSYSVIDKHVIITKKHLLKVTTEEREITGVVKDKEGYPLPGVSVTLKDAPTVGVSTDVNGKFIIKIANDKKVTLVFTFIGMKTKEITVGKKSNYIVILENDAEILDEVVISTGYQRIDRKLFTGSAAKVDAKDTKVDGVADVGRMLEGRVAGVSVQNVSGTFGAAPKIRVRGASSIYGDTKPLWVVDGVVLEDVVDVSPDDLSSGDAVTLISSSVAGINADDIENFQILKDASATALYGARAMNGVIVITTKKGKKGKTKINLSSEFTMKMKPSYSDYDIMNSQDQMSVLMELQKKGLLNHADVIRNQNGGIFYKMYNNINTYDAKKGAFVLENTENARNNFLRRYETANTDWFGVLFNNSLQQNHSLSISSGSENARYYASTSVLDDKGWTVADKVNRYTVKLKGDFDILKNLTLGLQVNASVRKQVVPGTFGRASNNVTGEFKREFDINPFSYALNTSRAITPYDENGKLEYFRMNYAPFNIINELNNNKIELNVIDLNLQADLSYKINSHLEYKFAGAVRFVRSTNEHKVTRFSNVAGAYRATDDAIVEDHNKYLYRNKEKPNERPISVLNNGGLYNRQDNYLENYYFRNIVNFNNTYDETHSVNVILGQELRSTDRQNSWSNGYGYQYDKGGIPFTDYRIVKQILENGFAYYGNGYSYDRFLAFFISSAYSYLGKYTVNITSRYDGSNKLGKSKSARWLPTWNISGKWNIKEEPSVQEINWLSNLSLRGTYGLTASMGPSTNSSVIYRNSVSFRQAEYEKESQMYVQSLENSELTWEKQYETNIGFDFGLFNRINLSIDAYHRRGFDLIAAIRTSGIGGDFWKYGNYADMISKGVEFSINTRNVLSDDFSWDTGFTFSIRENEITNLKSKPNVFDLVRSEGGAVQGGSVRDLYSIPFAGLNEQGLPTFYNEEGEIVIGDVNFQSNDIDYLKFEGSIDPKLTGGFSNRFKYKNWDLNVFCSYSFGNVVRLYPSFSSSYSDWNAMSKDMKNRWVLPGDEKVTNIPTIPSDHIMDNNTNINRAYNAYNYSDQRVAKGDFIRLKEVSINYNLPKSLCKKINIANASLKLQGTNLFLLYSDKKLNGQDPEFIGAGGVAMPIPHQYTLTFKLGF